MALRTIIVEGLQSNYYLANNPIFITVRETVYWDYATVKVGNLPVATVTPIDNEVRFDIAPFIKSLMPNVSFNVSDNIISAEIRVTTFRRLLNNVSIVVSQATFNKTFIRGGNSRNLPNYNVSANQILKVTDKLPYWSGYNAMYSRMVQVGSTNTISEYPLNNPQDILEIERLSVKGCNPKFVKFLNRLGGYSYWLFEVSETTLTNNDLGTINNNYIADLGYSYNEEVELYSKVPERYMALMEDLIFSPSTWLFEKEENKWHRVKLSNNNVKINRANKAQEFRIKIKPFTNYNPSLIW